MCTIGMLEYILEHKNDEFRTQHLTVKEIQATMQLFQEMKLTWKLQFNQPLTSFRKFF
jgi:hypothetical protein